MLYLARKYNVPQWIQPERKQLCSRLKPLEVGEAARIGWDTAVLLAKAREILRDESRREPDEPPADKAKRRSHDELEFWPEDSELYTDWRVTWALEQAFGTVKSDCL